MAARPQADKGKKSPGIYVIVGLVGLLVVFVAYLARTNIYATPAPPPMTPEAHSRNDRLSQLARQSGGDINQLSADDRTWVNNLTGGRGADVLRGMAQNAKR